jgi:hydroxyethylthiazole kinase-like uncharacterized protein yjeF
MVKRLAELTGYQTPLVHLVAGRGNNGGDAFAAARYLREAGFDIEVWLAGSHDQLQGAALLHYGKLKTLKIKVHDLPTLDDWKMARARPFVAEIIVDGVLGTGLTGPARGPAAGAIQYINSQAGESIVVAIDVPSGLDADRGSAEGDVVTADVTVTFGQPKQGLLLASALEHVGALEVSDIGIPREYVLDYAGRNGARADPSQRPAPALPPAIPRVAQGRLRTRVDDRRFPRDVGRHRPGRPGGPACGGRPGDRAGAGRNRVRARRPHP